MASGTDVTGTIVPVWDSLCIALAIGEEFRVQECEGSGNMTYWDLYNLPNLSPLAWVYPKYAPDCDGWREDCFILGHFDLPINDTEYPTPQEAVLAYIKAVKENEVV